MSRKTLILWLAGIALAGAALGALVMVSGIVSVAASSGHWKITEWVLHFAMRRSVATHSLPVAAPDLDDPAMVLRGAGHYAAGCAPCHGGPGVERSPVAPAMTPPPPFLPPSIPTWENDELFWIVKHGVKFTAMPAWPTQARDDEVWSMVAFLRRLPELNPAAYRHLTMGPVAENAAPADGAADLRRLLDPFGEALTNCARCHGVDGNGRGEGAFPRLAGQREDYLVRTLRAFASGERASGFMRVAAATLTDEQMRELARHFAEAPPRGAARQPEPSPSLVAEGRAIAFEGLPARGVPPCRACHGPAAGHPTLAVYPRLAGQVEGYLAAQLELFRHGERGGTAFAPIMRVIAGRLTPEQARAAAAYYATLDPAQDGR